MMEKVKTYIDGFDKRMNGGIPKGSIVLIIGEPGTMKSSLAYSILYNNALKNKEVGTYVTLEQSRKGLLRHLKSMGFNIDAVGDKISVVDLSLIRRKLEKLGEHTWMHIFKSYAKNLKENMDYTLLVIDSLQVLELLAGFERPRNELFHFFGWIKDLGVTTFIVAEQPSNTMELGKYGEDFLSDGIIHLKMEKVDDINIQRRIRCVKMRETKHSFNYYTLLFQNGVFQATKVINE